MDELTKLSTASFVLDVLLPLIVSLGGSGIVLGTTSTGSKLRLAWLPVDIALVNQVVSSSSTYLRKNHGRLLGSFAAGILIHWIDVALISKWTFQKDRDTRSTATKLNSYDGLLNKSSLDRVRWGIESLFESRRLNRADEVKNVSALHAFAAKSRLRFILYAAIKLCICYVVVDILTPHPATDAATSRAQYALWKIPIFARLWQGNKIPLAELIFRAVFTCSFWLLTYSMMSAVVLTAAIIAVGTGMQQPEDCKPFFGNICDAYSFRGFWGSFWHQGFRAPFSNLSRSIVETFLSPGVAFLSPRIRAWIVRYAKLFGTFAVSGVFHVAGDLAAKGDLTGHQTMAFFLTQAAGIMVEDHVKILYHQLTIVEDGETTKRWQRVVGYVWCGLFLIWTTPQWMYPSLVTNTAESKPFLPFSFVEYVKRSKL